MRAPGLLLAGTLSFLPFALALTSGGSLRPEGATWTALALAPWLALAGLPRRASPLEEPRATWLLPAALALPLLGLAAGSDVARLLEPLARTLVVALGGLALLGLWSAAAPVAGGRAGSALYGLLWLVLVPGAAAAVWALSWAPGAGAAPWVQGLELALPLPWLASAAERGGPAGAGRLSLGLLGNAGVVLALGALVRAVDRHREEEPA